MLLQAIKCMLQQEFEQRLTNWQHKIDKEEEDEGDAIYGSYIKYLIFLELNLLLHINYICHITHAKLINRALRKLLNMCVYHTYVWSQKMSRNY